MVFIFIDPKSGPTLGDLADAPWWTWLICLAMVFAFVGWMAIDMKQRSDWEACERHKYPYTQEDIDRDVSHLDCRAILKLH